MDFQALLYNPVYGVIGVQAVLAIGTHVETGLTVLDKTRGVDLVKEFGDVTTNVAIQTIVPAAVLRAAELIEREIDVEALIDATITFNAKSWRVRSYRLRPSPNGEGDGEIYLLLVEP